MASTSLPFAGGELAQAPCPSAPNRDLEAWNLPQAGTPPPASISGSIKPELASDILIWQTVAIANRQEIA